MENSYNNICVCNKDLFMQIIGSIKMIRAFRALFNVFKTQKKTYKNGLPIYVVVANLMFIIF